MTGRPRADRAAGRRERGADAGAAVLAAQHVAMSADSVVVRVRIEVLGGAPAVEVAAEELGGGLPAAAARPL